MPRPRITFDIVRTIGLALPGAEEGTSYGAPALKVGGKMFACMPTNKSAEPDSLVVCIDFAQRDELLAADPATYYVTEHYVDHPSVLVRLTRVHRDALSDILRAAHRFVAVKARRPKARPRR
jgi:hypothetical protein